MPTALPGLPLSVDDDLITPELMAEQKALWEKKNRQAKKARTTTKGGPGSGNRGHKGVPGHLGGSAPGDAQGVAAGPQPQAVGQAVPMAATVQPAVQGQLQVQAQAQAPAQYAQAAHQRATFDRTLISRPIPDRISAWEALPIEERDRQANARQTIRAAQTSLIAEAGERPIFSGDVRKDVAARLTQLKDFTTPEAHDRIKTILGDSDAVFERMKIKPELRYKLGMEMTDTLVAQESEAMTRQLGDHGIHHIQGNIEMATTILEKIPGQDTDRARAQVYIANVFHDTGYLTEPSRNFLDEGHPRWSAEHYDENMRPLVAQAIGPRAARDITHMITTHAGTDIDWKADPVASAVRVSDNLALFQREKLPPVFRVTGNVGTLVDLHNGRIDVATARQRMIANIGKTSFSERVKSQLIKGANEVNERTGKFTLGMLGGRVDSVNWTGEHLKVALRENRNDTVLNKLLDLGQKQLAKFAKSYHIDPNEFLKNLAFKFPPDGPTVLETVVVQGARSAKKEIHKVLGILYGRKH